jgi:hypothetical protein
MMRIMACPSPFVEDHQYIRRDWRIIEWKQVYKRFMLERLATHFVTSNIPAASWPY